VSQFPFAPPSGDADDEGDLFAPVDDGRCCRTAARDDNADDDDEPLVLPARAPLPLSPGSVPMP
jgi:hypothetical protein